MWFHIMFNVLMTVILSSDFLLVNDILSNLWIICGGKSQEIGVLLIFFVFVLNLLFLCISVKYLLLWKFIEGFFFFRNFSLRHFNYGRVLTAFTFSCASLFLFPITFINHLVNSFFLRYSATASFSIHLFLASQRYPYSWAVIEYDVSKFVVIIS